MQKTHIEVATLKAKNATLERELTEKEKQCAQINSKFTYLEQVNNFYPNLNIIKHDSFGTLL